MVKYLLLSLLIVLLSTAQYGQAQEIPSSAGAHDSEIFAGAGEALTFPSSLRYRSGAIEGGYLYNGLFGAAKMFKNPSYPSTYTEFGGGVFFYDGVKPAFYGSMGVRFTIWRGLKFRSELNMTGGLNSYVKGGALVGLSLVF